MRRVALAIPALSVLLTLGSAGPAHAAPGDGPYSGDFEAGGSLTDDGGEAHASSTSVEAHHEAHRSGGTVQCSYYDDGTGEQFDPGSVDPNQDWGNGILIARICVDTATGEQVSFEDGITWEPRQGAPMDPRALAEIQVSRLAVPEAGVATSPSQDRDQLVRVPTWLWIASGWAPITTTASAGPVTATVTATPNRVVWDMGDGHSVTCTGPGAPYDSGRPADEQDTDCSYTYERTSAGQPGDRFHGTATVYWTIAFTSNVGAGGALGEVSQSSNFTLRVAQAQALNQ